MSGGFQGLALWDAARSAALAQAEALACYERTRYARAFGPAAESDPPRAAEAEAWEAYIASTHACDAAEALVDAVENASWGQQSDGSFVTIAAQSCGSLRRVRRLHARSRGGPLAIVEGGTLVKLYSRSEASAIREAERARNRAAQAAYEERRRAAGEALRAGRALDYFHGQLGGCVRLDSGSEPVSAAGALRAAGVEPGDVLAILHVAMERGAKELAL